MTLTDLQAILIVANTIIVLVGMVGVVVLVKLWTRRY